MSRTTKIMMSIFTLFFLWWMIGAAISFSVKQQSYITIYDEIDQKTATKIIDKLKALQDGDINEPIYMYINSPGGQVFEGLRIIDAMKASKRPIYTVDVGTSASMAAYIFFYGQKRFIFPHAIIMLHNVSGMDDGAQNETLAHRMAIVANIVKDLNQNIASTSNASLQELLYKENTEWWIQPKEAIDRKFVNQIINIYPPRE